VTGVIDKSYDIDELHSGKDAFDLEKFEN